MERIVYVLGAGFSAPLGLPVIGNFFERAQDLYRNDPDRYAHFRDVFSTIKDMTSSLNYYSANLRNIEEILSILEMGQYLQGRRLKNLFADFIADVIEAYTPTIRMHSNEVPGNWTDWLFGSDPLWGDYGVFASHLFNLRFTPLRGRLLHSYAGINVHQDPSPANEYAVVTLNYDMVLESTCQFVNDNYTVPQVIAFAAGLPGKPGTLRPGDTYLAKLHGSVDTRVIIAPTWSKGVNRKVIPAWKLAYALLSEATQIRIIGYSLAHADAYIKYLLKAAALKSQFLKRIDVIALDKDGALHDRFAEFVKLDTFKFANGNVMEYLGSVRSKIPSFSEVEGKFLEMKYLESSHSEFMRKHAT